MPRFRRRFTVRAPLDRVVDFHRRPASLKAITPPLVPMRFLGQVPEVLEPGDELAFRMWAGPLPLHWRSRIEELEGDGTAGTGSGVEGFRDRQLDGPFAHWLHRHRFRAAGDGVTEVDDEIEVSLARHPFWWLVGAKMWLGLPLMFAYRRWKTRRLLEGAAGRR